MSVSARLTRQSGTSFYYAFLILPARKRRAIFALYSFCRIVDDCVDEPDGGGEAGLRGWLEEVHACYAGRPATELGRELTLALAEFPIPRSCFEEIVAGCRMDLTVTRYPAFHDLREYCLKVASAVGLASIEIFGYEDDRTRQYAVDLGLALQLTNILRDVAVDAERGRLYIPLEDLARFGVSEAALLEAAAAPPAAPRPKAIDDLLAFQAGRAQEHFDRAHAALPAVDRRSMVSAEMMGAVYHDLLDTLTARGYPLLRPALRLSKGRKAWVALRSVARVYTGR